jgi:hypothetical protein
MHFLDCKEAWLTGREGADIRALARILQLRIRLFNVEWVLTVSSTSCLMPQLCRVKILHQGGSRKIFFNTAS